MLLKHNTLCFPADELIIRAGKDFPNSGLYEGFGQLENGVGMVTLFSDQFISTLNKNKNMQEYKESNHFSNWESCLSFYSGLNGYSYGKWDRIKVKPMQ